MIRVWRVADLSLVRVLRGHRGSVLCLLALGPLLLSGARDNAIRCVTGRPCFCAFICCSLLELDWIRFGP